MIKEVIIVEGKMDVAAVRRAVDADCIITDGFRLRSAAIKNIRAAYEKRGIIILTDPDTVGERIRTATSAWSRHPPLLSVRHSKRCARRWKNRRRLFP